MRGNSEKIKISSRQITQIVLTAGNFPILKPAAGKKLELEEIERRNGVRGSNNGNIISLIVPQWA